MQQPEKHNPSKISLGVDGLNSLNQLDLEKIPSSQTLTEEAEQLSPQHLQRQSEQENFQDNLIPLVAATVHSTVDNVSQTFRDFAQSDPRYNKGGRTVRLLQQQYKGYKEADPEEKHKKAKPMSVFKKNE